MIRSSFALAAALLAALPLAGPVHAGDPATGARPGDKQGSKKDFSAKGSVTAHKVELIKDVPYVIEVKAKNFQPYVIIVGTPLPFSPNFDSPTTFKSTFTAKESREYTVIVSPQLFGLAKEPDGTLDYTLTIKALGAPGKALVNVAGKWTDEDMKYAPRDTYFKAYPIKMKAGKTYVIDLVRPGMDFKLDPYLYLEDANKKVVAQDDDGGGNLNARIVYTPTEDGEYRIIATTLRPATGAFTLTVRGPGSDKGEEKKSRRER